MNPKLLLSYACERTVLPGGARMFKHFATSLESQQLFVHVFWFIHCKFFQVLPCTGGADMRYEHPGVGTRMFSCFTENVFNILGEKVTKANEWYKQCKSRVCRFVLYVVNENLL